LICLVCDGGVRGRHQSFDGAQKLVGGMIGVG